MRRIKEAVEKTTGNNPLPAGIVALQVSQGGEGAVLDSQNSCVACDADSCDAGGNDPGCDSGCVCDAGGDSGGCYGG